MNPWSTRVPVELSNRELHRQGWEHDGVCLKIAVAETRAVSGGQRFCDGTNSRHRRNGIGRTATRAYSNSASSDFGRGRTQGSDELAPGTPEQALEGEAPDSESTSRTGKSLANGGWRLSVTRQAGCQTRPGLLVCGGAPRRNRTGDPILTMEPPGTAVRTAVLPGRARPSGQKLSVLFRRSYALTLTPCADRRWSEP